MVSILDYVSKYGIKFVYYIEGFVLGDWGSLLVPYSTVTWCPRISKNPSKDSGER
jgi:hypothetical protein